MCTHTYIYGRFSFVALSENELSGKSHVAGQWGPLWALGPLCTLGPTLGAGPTLGPGAHFGPWAHFGPCA